MTKFYEHYRQAFQRLDRHEISDEINGENVRWQIEGHAIVAEVDYADIKELDPLHQYGKLAQRLDIAVKETTKWCMLEALKQESWGSEFSDIFNNLINDENFLNELSYPICFRSMHHLKLEEDCVSTIRSAFLSELIKEKIAAKKHPRLR